MKITTIEQLKQRIGKFVVLSKVDPNCNDDDAFIKRITNIEKSKFLFDERKDKGELYNYKIWGTCTAHKNPPFYRIPSNVHDKTYVHRVLYARDPTEQELKMFLNMWRIYEYKENKRIFPI